MAKKTFGILLYVLCVSCYVFCNIQYIWTKCVSHVCRVTKSPKQHKQVKLEITQLHSVIFNFITPCCAMKCVESSRLK